jgi:hypothetical protein
MDQLIPRVMQLLFNLYDVDSGIKVFVSDADQIITETLPDVSSIHIVVLERLALLLAGQGPCETVASDTCSHTQCRLWFIKTGSYDEILYSF